MVCSKGVMFELIELALDDYFRFEDLSFLFHSTNQRWEQSKKTIKWRKFQGSNCFFFSKEDLISSKLRIVQPIHNEDVWLFKKKQNKNSPNFRNSLKQNKKKNISTFVLDFIHQSSDILQQSILFNFDPIFFWLLLSQHFDRVWLSIDLLQS